MPVLDFYQVGKPVKGIPMQEEKTDSTMQASMKGSSLRGRRVNPFN
jgi:hypothetical protein